LFDLAQGVVSPKFSRVTEDFKKISQKVFRSSFQFSVLGPEAEEIIAEDRETT